MATKRGNKVQIGGWFEPGVLAAIQQWLNLNPTWDRSDFLLRAILNELEREGIKVAVYQAARKSARMALPPGAAKRFKLFTTEELKRVPREKLLARRKKLEALMLLVDETLAEPLD